MAQLDYLNIIAQQSLSNFIQTETISVFPGFSTVNPEYRDRLIIMQKSLFTYIDDESLVRPLLYLILGPPGSGKSYLVKCLTKACERMLDQQSSSTLKLKFQAINLSELGDPSELHTVFQTVVSNSKEGAFTITFFDEFDITLGGSSAIKYLITPIYDGKFWDGIKFSAFGRCAFFFAGSYLQDLETLRRVQKQAAAIKMEKFLLDLYLNIRRLDDQRGLTQIRDIQEFCHTHQRWKADVDPQSDVVHYLRSLEKIKDFLSRIGGNAFEIIDLSWPLGITHEHFAIEESEVSPSAKLKLSEILGFITSKERSENNFRSYRSFSNPLLEYKNILLCERLTRVIQNIVGRFGSKLKCEGKSEILIDRRLLNFLALTPLVNGMRSLEQLVNQISVPINGHIGLCPFPSAALTMIVHPDPRFSSPLQTWEELTEANPRFAARSFSSPYISIPLP